MADVRRLLRHILRRKYIYYAILSIHVRYTYYVIYTGASFGGGGGGLGGRRPKEKEEKK